MSALTTSGHPSSVRPVDRSRFVGRPVATVSDRAVPLLHLSVLGSVAVVGFAAAVLAFQRRDIAG